MSDATAKDERTEERPIVEAPAVKEFEAPTRTEREIIKCGNPVKMAKGVVRLPLTLRIGDHTSTISLTISIEEDSESPAGE